MWPLKSEFKNILEEIIVGTETKYHTPLLARLRRRIRWDIRVSNKDCILKECNGAVVVSGAVDRDFRKEALLRTICATSGVDSIIDQVRVVPDFYRSDGEIERLVRDGLKDIDYQAGEWINVRSVAGEVKLCGKVFRPRMKAFAERVVWELSGVKDCLNLIEVSDPKGGNLQFHNLNVVNNKIDAYPITKEVHYDI